MRLLSTFFWLQRIILVGVVLGAGAAYAQSGGKNVGWTLADWMAQKRQFRLMDHWLAMNTRTPVFEFGFEGGKISYDATINGVTSQKETDRYAVSFYASIFGIEGGIEKSNEDLKYTWGQLNVRLFGESSRTTNLVAGYGLRKREDTLNNLDVTNQYGNVKLQLYIFSFLGVDGGYRKDFRASDQANNTYEGERAEYGAFLEYEFIRLYGRAFKDTTYKTPVGGVTQKETRDGVDAGVKFFF